MNYLFFSRSYLARLVVLTGFFSLVSPAARAEYQDRLELGAGIVATSSQTNIEIGTEYEHRTDPTLGFGATASLIFSNPAILLVAVPNVFFHPTGKDWLVSAAPLVEFTSGGSTDVGFRIGTRIPIPLGKIALIPEAAVDFIANGPFTIIGLGIGF